MHLSWSSHDCSSQICRVEDYEPVQIPTIHFDQRGKRTTATLYVGNLEFKASTKDLKDALDKEFD
jgi:hypothetical protein